MGLATRAGLFEPVVWDAASEQNRAVINRFQNVNLMAPRIWHPHEHATNGSILLPNGKNVVNYSAQFSRIPGAKREPGNLW